MHFDFTGEQKQFADASRKMFAEFGDITQFTTDRRPNAAELGSALAEMGLLGICATESSGGLGLGVTDALPVLVECGRALLPFHVAETNICSVAIGSLRPDLAKDIIAGRMLATLSDQRAVSARIDGDELVLNGGSGCAPWASESGCAVVAIEGTPGFDFALCDLGRAGVEVGSGVSADLSYSADTLSFSNYRLSRGEAGRWSPEAAALRGLLRAAEIVGASEALMARTIEYVKDRQQFGQSIGKFQAIKHLLADDAVCLENARLVLMYAAWAVDAGEPEALTETHLASFVVADHGRKIAEDAVQAHGGIGFTWDGAVHLHLRRIMRCGLERGGTNAALDAVGDRVFATELDRLLFASA